MSYKVTDTVSSNRWDLAEFRCIFLGQDSSSHTSFLHLLPLRPLFMRVSDSTKYIKVLAETLRLGCAMVSGSSTTIQINPGGIRLALNSRSLPSAHRIGRWRQLPSAVQRGFPARSRLLRPIPVRILRIHQLGHSPRGILGHLAISRGDTCAIRLQQFRHQFLHGTDIFIPLLHLLRVGRRGDI